MKTEMTTYEGAKVLTKDEYASWTMSGAFALIEYLEQIEDECDMSIEFDPVQLRCEYSEYKSLSELAKDFWNKDCHLHWATDSVIRNFICDKGVPLIEFDGGVILNHCSW
tara:strand:+ start:432 stop:761 length:330 start_codon:yes stop_codon:yes gene_type:complete